MFETTIEEILEAQAGDQEMLNNIVEKNSRLIWSIVKRFKNSRYETEDLFQIGAVGLIKSIDEEFDDGKETTLFNKIKVESHENETIRNLILKEELNKLDEKEKNIIILRYFYNKTQSQIAEKYGISQVQVSRIEKRILLKMRGNIKEKL